MDAKALQFAKDKRWILDGKEIMILSGGYDV